MEGFYRMTPFEVATGWVTGYERPEDHPRGHPDDPLDALRSLLLPPLVEPPCFVEFSGGRDSSAILATAVDVARRHGLQPPVPMTRVYPEVPESQEDDWQEQVIRHLQIEEWHRTEYTDEFDLLGPAAVESLQEHGLLWPPTIHTKSLVWQAAGEGTVVSGEGGDEYLGLRRLTPLAGLLAGNVHPRRLALARTARNLAPGPLRKRMLDRDLNREADRPWLREGATRRFRSALIEDRAGEPLWWDAATRRHPLRRADLLGLGNLRKSASAYGIVYLAPFHESTFVEALASRGGRLGFPGRSTAMRALFGDILPREVLEREDKAVFTRTFFGRHSRSFVDDWDDDGVDVQLVDPSALRLEWSKEDPNAASLALLQSAWLATRG